MGQCNTCGQPYCDSCTTVHLTTSRLADLSYIAGVSDENNCLKFAPVGDLLRDLVATDTPSIIFTTGGDGDHEISADVRISADPCNSLEIRADGLFSCEDMYFAESINEEVGAPFESFQYGANQAPYVSEPAQGSWLIANPSDCKSMKLQIKGDIPVVLDNGLDATTVSWDRSFILLEVDVGTGPAIISAKQSSRQTGNNNGENVQGWNVIKCFTLAPGEQLNVPWKLTFINDQGNSAGGAFWLPTLAIWGHTI